MRADPGVHARREAVGSGGVEKPKLAIFESRAKCSEKRRFANRIVNKALDHNLFLFGTPGKLQAKADVRGAINDLAPNANELSTKQLYFKADQFVELDSIFCQYETAACADVCDCT